MRSSIPARCDGDSESHSCFSRVLPAWEDQAEAPKYSRKVFPASCRTDKADRLSPEFQPDIPPTPDIQATLCCSINHAIEKGSNLEYRRMSFNRTVVRLTFIWQKILPQCVGDIPNSRGEGFGRNQLQPKSEISCNPNQGEESYGESERKKFHQAVNNANRDSWSDHIGGWLGVWTKFLGGHLRLRARQHWSRDPGNGCYRKAHRDRADAHGSDERGR